MSKIRIKRQILSRNNRKYYGYQLTYQQGDVDIKLQLTKTELKVIQRLIKQELDNEPYIEPIQNKAPNLFN